MNYYFTFGSNPQFPYGRDEYVVVIADSMLMAQRMFMAVHPNPESNDIVNCAFTYTEERFNEFRDKYYKGVEPSEVIGVVVNKKEVSA